MSASEYHINVDQVSKSPVELLTEASGLSRQRIKQVMQKGAVWLERQGGVRRLRRVKSRLQVGDRLHFYYNEKVLGAEPEEASLVVDEGDYSVWYKPKGMLSHGSKWGDHCAIDRWVQTHLIPERPVFLVHRLDRATDGLIVLAHKKRVAGELARLFRERKVKKRYRSWVVGRFSCDGAEKVIDTPIDGRSAISRLILIQYDEMQDRSLLDVKIDTGRKHQIRRHLSGAGHHVVGDRLYGDKRADEDLQLTCVYLEIPAFDQTEPRIYRL
jgi:tRNA pseudouridine32 synthase/23S rRNA pseudouridine746 synthase